MFEQQLRTNIRNAWLAESVADILKEARNRLAQGKSFEADCLIELAMEDNTEVIVEVKGGVAEVTKCPNSIEVKIIDKD